MAKRMLVDAGPVIALLNERDAYHGWAVEQFKRFPRFTTCDAVLAEACARLAYYGRDQSKMIELVAAGVFVVDFDSNREADRVARLMRKYADRPMDFADACLVAMSERVSDSVVVTLDAADFAVYRRHGREIVRYISPAKG